MHERPATKQQAAEESLKSKLQKKYAKHTALVCTGAGWLSIPGPGAPQLLMRVPPGKGHNTAAGTASVAGTLGPCNTSLGQRCITAARQLRIVCVHDLNVAGAGCCCWLLLLLLLLLLRRLPRWWPAAGGHGQPCQQGRQLVGTALVSAAVH